MGKASRRKTQRRQGIGPSRADFETRRSYQVLLTGMQRMISEFDADEERRQQARRAWAGGADPPRAALTQWREDSVGDRFFSAKPITDAAGAPILAEATPPSPQQMAENSKQWVTAVYAVVRAVVLEGSPVDDPEVTRVLDLLAPIVLDELAAEAGENWDFPDADGPLFLLGGYLLSDATWAIVGLDPLDQALSLMEHTIGKALAGAGHAGWPDGKVVAKELVRAFGGHYQCQEPGDVRTLERLGRSASGNPLIDLIQAEAVSPEDALRLGLITLVALADLARTDADSAAGQLGVIG